METQAGETTAANRELKGRMQIGATKAGQAASGVDVNTGSFVGARGGRSQDSNAGCSHHPVKCRKERLGIGKSGFKLSGSERIAERRI